MKCLCSLKTADFCCGVSVMSELTVGTLCMALVVELKHAMVTNFKLICN